MMKNKITARLTILFSFIFFSIFVNPYPSNGQQTPVNNKSNPGSHIPLKGSGSISCFEK
jgi:hypothetical protein